MLETVSMPGPVFCALLALAYVGLVTCLKAVFDHAQWSIKIVRKGDKHD